MEVQVELSLFLRARRQVFAAVPDILLFQPTSAALTRQSYVNTALDTSSCTDTVTVHMNCKLFTHMRT